MGPAELESSRPLKSISPNLTAPARKVRAFFGLPVAEPHRDELGHFITACAVVAPSFRWTPISNLHLTVRFIGSIEREAVDGIADRIGELPLAGFELELGEIGTFKRGRLVRVVWLGLRSRADAAAALAARVEAECRRAGLVADERPFQPHVTLARAHHREGSELPPLPPVPELGPWRAAELVLYSSHLSRTGAVYEAIRKLPLAAR